jgi:hypothetical protein
MAKSQFTEDDDDLLAELGVEVEGKSKNSRTPGEERIIAGFEDIERFVEQHGRLPMHGEDRDIFERLYAVRLDQIRSSEECLSILSELDSHGILKGTAAIKTEQINDLDDDELLAELGVLDADNDITKLTHVKTRAEIKAAEEIADRTPCKDFDRFRPLFENVAKDIASGVRLSRQIRKEAGFLKSQIKVGDFFILYGQTVYIAEIGEPIKGSNETMDARLRVIYSNGTESNLLLDSLRRGLYKDESSRIISEPSAGPLFSDQIEGEDLESGTIYVLRSKSDHPMIKGNREVIHKIGVTGNDVEKRVSIAKNDPTFLMADVEIVATYKLANINRVKLEALIHKFFASARLDIQIVDRFGQPVTAREWFLVPLFVIDELVEKIRNNSVKEYYYNPITAQISRNHS